MILVEGVKIWGGEDWRKIKSSEKKEKLRVMNQDLGVGLRWLRVKPKMSQELG